MNLLDKQNSIKLILYIYIYNFILLVYKNELSLHYIEIKIKNISFV